jgi:DNA helicase IV
MLIPYNDLSEKQKNVIKKIARQDSGNIFVEGPPGSGKTLISLHTLKDIVSNTVINPLLLIYNHSLFGYLNNAIKDIGITDNITIATKDKYFWNLAKQMNIFAPAEFNMDSKYIFLLNKLAEIELTVSFDVVVIDEVQDFNELEWRVIKKIAKRIITLGDFDQGIYESGLSYEMMKNQGVYAKLETIFRFHKNIAKLAQFFSRKKENLEDKVTKVSKTQPKIYDLKHGEEFDKIVEIIKGVQQNRKTIGIITPDKTNLISLSNYLKSKGVIHFYYLENKDLRTHDFNDISPLLITSFSAKGLEFENVILYGFDTDSSAVFQLRKKNRLNDVIYVSITRTNTNLFIVRTPNSIKEILDIKVDIEEIQANQPSIDDLF